MSVQGALVRDIARTPVGRVVDVLLDPDSHDPRWLRVAPDGSTDGAPDGVLVPASAVSEFAAGELIVPYDAATIRRAAHDSGSPVTEADAERLSSLYGFGG